MLRDFPPLARRRRRDAALASRSGLRHQRPVEATARRTWHRRAELPAPVADGPNLR